MKVDRKRADPDPVSEPESEASLSSTEDNHGKKSEEKKHTENIDFAIYFFILLFSFSRGEINDPNLIQLSVVAAA